MTVAPVPTIEKAQKTRRPARRTFMRALPHLVPCFVYFVYLVLGSWVFILIEGNNTVLAEYKKDVAHIKDNLEKAFDEASKGITNGTSWSDLLDNYTELMTKPEWKLGRYGNWTFSSSMLFCVITITTIGYGDIVPITFGGRIFVGVYAAIGIPLNVIFLADVGYLFAKAIVKVIRAIKLYKLRRRRAKERAKDLKLGNARPLSKFRRPRRKKYAKRGKKFKHRNKGRSKGVVNKKGGLTASRGMSIHARSVMQRNVESDDESQHDTSFTKDNHTTTPNGGRDLLSVQTTDPEKPTFKKAAKNSGGGRHNKRLKNKSGGLSASRNMSVHARSLRRRNPDDDEEKHYARRPRGRRDGPGMKRKGGHGGGISASRHMSVHARSILRHVPEDLQSEDTTSNDEPIKTVSEGIESVTKEILPTDITLSIPNSKSDADLVGNEQLSNFDHFENDDIVSNVGNQSISMASETTDKSSLDELDDSVDTEVPIIIVLTILILYICIGAVMMMYVENWKYTESLYFTIITLTTIGYGDMAPNRHYNNETFFTCIIFTIFGLAVMSTCIALVQAKVLRIIDKITRKIRKHAEL